MAGYVVHGSVQANDVWLEASMLPTSAPKSLKGTSQKTGSTASGSQSSGDNRPTRGAVRSDFESVNDDCCSSDNGSTHEETVDSRRKVQIGLQNTEVPPLDDDENFDDPSKFGSIFIHGPAFSVGSAQHPNGCQPCVHYCFSKRRGCNRGDDCSFCHSFHESKLQKKRQKWKGNKKPSKSEGSVGSGEAITTLAQNEVVVMTGMEAAKRGQVWMDGQVLKQAAQELLPVPQLAYAEAMLVPQPLAPKLAYSLGYGLALGDPMTITPASPQYQTFTPSNVGPAAGVGKLEGARIAPPPGLELDTFEQMAFSAFVCE